MIKLKAEPYTLRLRPDVQESETMLRKSLNLEWCTGVFFNVLTFKNMSNKIEYDAILWNSEAILFIEYKDSVKAYKDFKAHDAQQKKDYARNIARTFGFKKYNFIIVVRGLEDNIEKVKGKSVVIPQAKLSNYIPEPEFFESTLIELDRIEELLNKYNSKENGEFKKDKVLEELKDLRDMIEQVNS